MVILINGISLLANNHLYLGEAMAQPVVFNDYMPRIWNTLMAEFNNEKGVAGLMGNLYAESGCTPYACQPTRPYNVCMTYINNVDTHAISEYNFVHKGCSSTGGVASVQLGFGLAQWTYYTRKQGLYTYMYQNGNSIGDLDNQINYVIEEITADQDMYDVVANATDIDTVSDYILANFENPEVQTLQVKQDRRSWSTDIYNEYSGTTPIEPVNPQPPSPSSPIPDYTRNTKMYEMDKKMPLWMMLRNRRC